MSQIVKYRQFRGMIKELYLKKKKKRPDTCHGLGTGQPFSMTMELIDGGSITFLTELSVRKVSQLDYGISGQTESRYKNPGLQITL